MIVVIILAVIAAIVVPQYTNAHEETAEVAVRRQLQILRHQVEYYRARHDGADPDLRTDWDDLLAEDLIVAPPINQFNLSTVVSTAAGPGVGWVWRDTAAGDTDVFATDASWAEWPED
jgi:Tfp pilus assembly protein PilE